jgi:hypothetical protein
MVAGREVEAAATKSDTERKLTLWNAVQSNLCCIEIHSAYTYTYIYGYYFSRQVACCGPDVICKPMTLCIRKMMTSLLIKLD